MSCEPDRTTREPGRRRGSRHQKHRVIGVATDCHVAFQLPSAGSRCCIAPGRILSEMTGPPETAVNRAALSRIPVGRFGTAQEVADVVAFFASSLAAFITGATVDITGGEFAA
jgi:NAD(P)-dependent dehydrogenase (short-subunit alcohol dehydrogenase family)